MRKTDKDDALKLARLAAVGKLQPVSVPAKPVRQRKSLIGLCKPLIGPEGVSGTHCQRSVIASQER
jgi:hypothetical protein